MAKDAANDNEGDAVTESILLSARIAFADGLIFGGVVAIDNGPSLTAVKVDVFFFDCSMLNPGLDILIGIGAARGDSDDDVSSKDVVADKRDAVARPDPEKGVCAVNFGDVENNPRGCRWTDPGNGGVPGAIAPRVGFEGNPIGTADGL